MPGAPSKAVRCVAIFCKTSRMPDSIPFFREAGEGPGVVCLHANSSSSGQWRDLIESLAPRFHVFAPDAYGSGKSPPWAGGPLRLLDEVAFLNPIFTRADERFAIVGHSYGAAVALLAALSMTGRIAALVLYEPTLFSLLDAETPQTNEADGIRAAVASAVRELEGGNTYRAAQHFIDFWMYEGAWAAMPESRQAPIMQSIHNLPNWGAALFNDTTPLSAFATLDVPVLYMMGKDSPLSSRGVGRLLTATLPRVQVIEFEGLGHMGPVTHPQVVNDAIFRFIDLHCSSDD